MGKPKRGGSGTRNSDRPNGKAWKKKPKTHPKKTNSKRIAGYSMAKLTARAEKRGLSVDDYISSLKK